MKRRRGKVCGVIPWVLVATGLWSNAAAADAGTVRITAPWEGNGALYKVGPGLLQFLGTFEGIMYVESGAGDLDAAIFVCPTVEEIDLKTKQTKARGRCHIVAAGGNIYSEFRCDGDRTRCRGEMKLTGGTGEFEGISGSGEMVARTVLTSLGAETASGFAVEEAEGIAVWPRFEYTLPARE